MRQPLVTVAAMAICLSLIAADDHEHLPCQLRDRYQGIEPPTIPDGWTVRTFAAAPDISSPASMAVSPRGDVFVGEDPYNTGAGHEPGIGRVVICIDSDGDGQADTFKTFADNINSPQGMCFVNDTLYVAHAPYLSAFRDTDGDDIADERKDLIRGFGPIPEGLVHHVPSGVRMGIDGWLYISIGDKGIEEAIGTDGRKVRLLGGGVVRVRPDGTMMELYAIGLRNTYDIAIDPLLNMFMRDNTNDGGGWNSRIMQIQRNGSYGYPSLFLNFPEEIIPAIADHGGGSATGSIYIEDSRLPAPFNDSLYTIDWVKGWLYRHDRKPAGATFELSEEQFVKGLNPVDVDVDAHGRIFLCDWARRSWGKSDAQGIIYLLQPPHEQTTRLYRDPKALSDEQLLSQLKSQSLVRRLDAQCELLARFSQRDNLFDRESFNTLLALMHQAQQDFPLPVRVTALFTLKQIAGTEGHSSLAKLSQYPELREFAIRALGDRDDELEGIDIALIKSALADQNPRVREQAAITFSRFAPAEHHAALVPLAADKDVMVRHAAMRGLQRLDAVDACIAAVKADQDPEIVRGALLAMREMHDPRVVDALVQYLQRPQSSSRIEAVATLARLYRREGEWDGTWWRTVPDTRGPYYIAAEWEQSSRVAELLMEAARSDDQQLALAALQQIGRCSVAEAAPALADLAQQNIDAARALVRLRSDNPAAVRMLETMVLSDAFDEELRRDAMQALVRVEGRHGLEALARVGQALHSITTPPPLVLDPLTSALAGREANEDTVPLMMELVDNRHAPIRASAAAALLRSENDAAKQAVQTMWSGQSFRRHEALLLAITRLPAEQSADLVGRVREMLASRRASTRHAAAAALGHLKDPESIAPLLEMAARFGDRNEALLALAKMGPKALADQQLIAAAQGLVAAAAEEATAPSKALYTQLLSAAEQFLADPRIAREDAAALISQIRLPGVLHSFQLAGPIPTRSGSSFESTFAPEQTPADPLAPFTHGGQQYSWRPMQINNTSGEQALEMPDWSVAYLFTTYDSPAAGDAVLTLGSDDGIKAWVNGELAHANDVDRGLGPRDHAHVKLNEGSNQLLIKVNNNTGPAGVAARVRHKVLEFSAEEMLKALEGQAGDAARGRELFVAQGCNNCHTVDAAEPRKGPFLGDAGSKFDRRHLLESILQPAAVIAQGFSTQKIVASSEGGGETEHVGFVTRESADEIEMRDAAGNVTIIPASRIKRRVTLDGSTMPQGLADELTPMDLASLVGYLESLKNAPVAAGD